MASLRDKLNRLSSAAPSPPPTDRLLSWEGRTPLDARLLALPSSGLARLGSFPSFDPREALFLDTETTGLSGGAGTVAFLVGLGTVEGDAFVVRQHLMTGYAAEPLLLAAVSQAARGKKSLVTFNGRTFDAPLLASRYTMCRMENPLSSLAHLDLLPPSRRLWRLRVGACRLSALEEQVLGLEREGDVPGAEIPARYFSFLKTRDMSLLRDIIDHNRQDIVTLGLLLARLCEALESPLEQESRLDVFSAGRTLERRGEWDQARACYRLAARPRPVTSLERIREARCAGEANWRLSHLYRRAGQTGQAEAVWREMERKGQMGELPLIELAKLAEHAQKDNEAALELSRSALALAENEVIRAQIQRRMNRLTKKLGRKSNGIKG